jgi:hypothetical protein
MNAMSVAFFAVCSALFWNVYLKKLITKKIILCNLNMIGKFVWEIYFNYFITNIHIKSTLIYVHPIELIFVNIFMIISMRKYFN